MSAILPPDTDVRDHGFVQMESGLIVPEWVAKQQEEKRPKAMDLFCGCGGFSLGMMKAGFEVVAAADNDAFSAITYLSNLGERPMQFWWVEPQDEARMEKALHPLMFPKDRKPAKGKRRKEPRVFMPPFAGDGFRSHDPEMPGVKNFFFGDIAKLKGKDVLRALEMEVGELDCVCGSPPCQGFSYAGKQNVHDPRNSLVFEFARLICEMQPKTMVFENVPGILRMMTPDGVPVIDQFCRVLQDGGFSTMDALKKTLTAQTGTVGMLRHNSDKGKRGGRINPPKKRQAQRSLFA